MDVTPLIGAGRQLIHAYGDGGFRIAGQAYRGSVLVFAAHSQIWPVADMDDLTPDSLTAVADAGSEVDLLLLGCGRAPKALPAAIREMLRAAGITVEIMDTGAACRTFNVLLGEERRVAAALIALS